MNSIPTLYGSTGCVAGKEPLPARVERYRSAGVPGIELGVGITVAEGDLENLEGLKENILIHNYFPPPREPFVLNLASRNEDVRRRSIDLANTALEWCSRLGAPFYSVHGGYITDPEAHTGRTFLFPSPMSPQERVDALSMFVSSIEELLTTARRLDVDLIVENNVCYPHHVGKLLLQTTREFEELFERIDDRRLGILLDTGHLNVSASTLGFDRLTFPERLSDRIRATHMHDNDGSEDQHHPAESNSWIFGILPALSALDSIIVEARFESVGALAEYLEWLESHLASL